jgi:hypothetical protein
MNMKFNLKALLLGSLIGAAALVAAVEAQVITVPQVTSVGPTDLFQDVVSGQGTIPSYYATAAQINGVIGYQNAGVLATGLTLTFGNAQQEIIAQSAGTIAALTLTASPLPGDGQLNCYLNTQTTTAITWNANSTIITQAISGAPTAGVANTKVCMIWSAKAASWLRAQ